MFVCCRHENRLFDAFLLRANGNLHLNDFPLNKISRVHIFHVSHFKIYFASFRLFYVLEMKTNSISNVKSYGKRKRVLSTMSYFHKFIVFLLCTTKNRFSLRCFDEKCFLKRRRRHYLHSLITHSFTEKENAFSTRKKIFFFSFHCFRVVGTIELIMASRTNEKDLKVVQYISQLMRMASSINFTYTVKRLCHFSFSTLFRFRFFVGKFSILRWNATIEGIKTHFTACVIGRWRQ